MGRFRRNRWGFRVFRGFGFRFRFRHGWRR